MDLHVLAAESNGTSSINQNSSANEGKPKCLNQAAESDMKSCRPSWCSDGWHPELYTHGHSVADAPGT